MADWQYIIDIKKWIEQTQEEEITQKELAEKITALLKEFKDKAPKKKCITEDLWEIYMEELDSIIDDFTYAETIDEIDEGLEKLYDWGDNLIVKGVRGTSDWMNKRLAAINTVFKYNHNKITITNGFQSAILLKEDNK